MTERRQNVCPASRRNGDHCNHSWSHDECCWCGRTFGEEGAEGQRVIHLPSGRKGTVTLPVGDRAMVDWGGHESLVDHDELRTLPLGKRI